MESIYYFSSIDSDVQKEARAAHKWDAKFISGVNP